MSERIERLWAAKFNLSLIVVTPFMKISNVKKIVVLLSLAEVTHPWLGYFNKSDLLNE